MSPAHHWEPQDVVFELAILVRGSARVVGGKVFVAPVDAVLSPHTVLQPDFIYLGRSRLFLQTVSGAVSGAPDIAVEVMSPSSREVDSVRKPDLYAKAGVPEYSLVDPGKCQIIVHTLHEDRYIAGLSEVDGSVRSLVLPKLVIQPATFFAQSNQ